MADLFTRLVSGPAAAQIAPRVALLEPTRPEAFHMDEPEETAELRLRVQSKGEPPRPDSTPESPPYSRLGELRLRVQSKGDSAHSTSPHAASAGRASPQPVDPRAVDPRAVDPRAVDPRAVDPQAVDPRQVEPRQVEPRAVAPVAPGDVVRSEIRGEPAAHPLSRRNEPQAGALRPRESEVARPEVRPQQSERQGTERAQTVRISIGRIEIRAPQPPAAPILPPPPSAASWPEGLSLAEYLRGNDGRPR